jgi:hypothetical protein
MAGKWPAAAAVLLTVLTGCSTIRGIARPPDTGAPLALSPAEAERMRGEGWNLYEQQPRESARVTRAAELLAQAARALPDLYLAQVQAAQALSYVADSATQTAQKIDAAKQGIVLARHARELRPADVAGHYWYAINVGLLADADRSYGLNAVAEMQAALQRAGELDERYDYAGPLRILGILHLRTPPPPVSIGSNRKALRLLQHAVELFPEYPENYLYLAEAQHAVGTLDEAGASLHKVLSAPPPTDRLAESQQWQAAARELQSRWRNAQ